MTGLSSQNPLQFHRAPGSGGLNAASSEAGMTSLGPVPPAGGASRDSLLLAPMARQARPAVIEPGAQSPAVKLLQAHLVALGHLEQSTGVLDASTVAAVRAFQATQGQTPSGRVTSALMSDVARALLERGTLILGFGARGQSVQTLQRQLQLLGFSHAAEAGSFDAETAAAVEAFQRYAGLSPTGALDPRTQASLLARLEAQGILAAGQRGPAVEAVGQKLRALGCGVSPSARYDSALEAAVRKFQAANGLEVNGMIGQTTRAAIEAALQAQGILVPGMAGREVELFQRQLLKLGYLKQAPGGIFDAGTEAALRAFQEAAGLPVESLVTTRLREALQDRVLERVQRHAPRPSDPFLQTLAPAAMAIEIQHGIPAAVILAQAALESDWGRSAIGEYNVFGIKGEGSEGSVRVETREFFDGGWVRIEADFAKFADFTEALAHHGELFYNGRYEQALMQLDSPRDFVRAIQGIYATDPSYAAKLLRIMDDQQLAPETPWPPTRTPGLTEW